MPINEKILIEVMEKPSCSESENGTAESCYLGYCKYDKLPTRSALVDRMAKAMDKLNYLRAGACTLEEMAEVALDAIFPKREDLCQK